MFATLSYKDKEEQIQVMQTSSVCFNGSRVIKHACTECRMKKVKCTGEKSGCSKCSTNGITCVYPSIADRSRRKRKSSNADRLSCTTNPPKGSGNSGGSIKPSSAGEESCIMASCKNLGDSESISHPPAPSDKSDIDLAEAPFDFATIEHVSGTGSPDDFSWTTDPPSVPDFTDWDDFQTQYDLTNELPTPTVSMGAFNLPTPLSGALLMFPIESIGSDPSLHTDPNALGSLRGPRKLANGNCNQDDPKDCTCPQDAMHTLEELESRQRLHGQVSVSNVIAHQKQALAGVHRWLDCNNCSTPAAVRTLLTLILQQLTFFLEQGVACYLAEVSQDDHSMSSRYKCKNMMGELRIDSNHEWAQVMRVLLKIRAKDLEMVLGRLKEIALRELRESQLSILQSTERRARRIVLDLTESD